MCCYQVHGVHGFWFSSSEFNLLFAILIYFSFYFRADNFLPVFSVVGEEMKKKLEEVA